MTREEIIARLEQAVRDQSAVTERLAVAVQVQQQAANDLDEVVEALRHASEMADE